MIYYPVTRITEAGGTAGTDAEPVAQVDEILKLLGMRVHLNEICPRHKSSGAVDALRGST